MTESETTTPETTEQTALSLPWSYCECGCKGYVLMLPNNKCFWRRNGWTVYRGHFAEGEYFGRFKNQEEADRALRPHMQAAVSRWREDQRLSAGEGQRDSDYYARYGF